VLENVNYGQMKRAYNKLEENKVNDLDLNEHLGRFKACSKTNEDLNKFELSCKFIG
jgi:hypothetical protein